MIITTRMKYISSSFTLSPLFTCVIGMSFLLKNKVKFLVFKKMKYCFTLKVIPQPINTKTYSCFQHYQNNRSLEKGKCRANYA